MRFFTGPDFGLTQSYAFWFGDYEGLRAEPQWNLSRLLNILYSLMWDQCRAPAASGGPSSPHLQASLTSGPQVLPCILRRCRLLSFHPFPALIRPALMTFIRSFVDHLFLSGIIPTPVRRGIHLLPRKIEDTRAAMRAISSSPAGIIDCLVTVATIPFYDLIIRKFRPPIRWLALWLAWDIGRRDVCR